MLAKKWALLIVFALLFNFLNAFVPTVKAEFHNTNNLGYEFLDNNEVLHIWNNYDNYFFNVSNGVQFTNHYKEYWTHNILMLGYYAGDEWNLLYRTDNLENFNRNITGETNDYINATLWRDLTYGIYTFRLAIRYSLGVSDNELTIIPYICNLGVAIPYVLGFGWELKNIQIDNTILNDQIKINETIYSLNQEIDETYTNITRTFYIINETTNTTESVTVKNGEFYLENNINGKVDNDLYLKWNPEINYKVTVKSRTGQYNAPVTLFIRIGALDVDQEKLTVLNWHDAYIVDSYSEINQGNTANNKDLHPSDHATFSSSHTQSFNCSNVTRLVEVKFYIRHVGSPTGNAHAVLYAHSGVYGASSVPTGSPLATSDDVDVSAIGGAFSLVSFTFTGDQQYIMSAGTSYVIAYENPTSGTIDNANYVINGVDTSASTHPGNLGYFKNGAWGFYANADNCFYVYGETIISDTDAPIISAENPSNGSINVTAGFNVNLIWNCTIRDNSSFNWTIEIPAIGIDNAGISNSSNGDTNGSKNITINDVEYLFLFIIWVNATDGNNSVSESFNFTAGNNTGDCPPFDGNGSDIWLYTGDVIEFDTTQFNFIVLVILIAFFTALGETADCKNPKIKIREYFRRALCFFIVTILCIYGGVANAQTFAWYFSFVFLIMAGFYGFRCFINFGNMKKSEVT